MPQPIGVTFIPSANNQAEGPRQGQLNGPGGDLADAFKVLSLRLPRVLGAQALAPSRLLTSPGAAGVPGGFNPASAVFQALLDAMSGGSSYLGERRTPGSLSDFFGNEGHRSDPVSEPPMPRPPAPRIVPGDVPVVRQPVAWQDEPPTVPPASMGDGGVGRGRPNRYY
jgi:hypothetical protein